MTFEGPEGVSRAIELLSGREVEGRPLYIREDRTDIEQEEGFVVFVRVVERGARGGRGGGLDQGGRGLDQGGQRELVRREKIGGGTLFA